jgi:hypothetical protein
VKPLAGIALGLFVLWPYHGICSETSADYLYRLHCSGCHGLDGMGSKIGRIPRFPGVVDQLPKVPEGRFYLVLVPGLVNAALSDDDTARVLNYVLRKWGHPDSSDDVKDFTADEVKKIRQTHIDDIIEFRSEIRNKLAAIGIDIDY